MTNNTALITGGSSGIGAEFARQLGAKGYNLLLVSNQQDQLEETQKRLSALYPDITVLTLFQDLALETSAEEVMQYCKDNEITVEVLINNSGIFTFKKVLEHSQKQISIYTRLHMQTVTHMCMLFGEEMAKRGKGYILNMSSMSCWMPMPGIAMYSATKAYIRVFSRSLHLELKESGVHVMVACPGGIATDLFGLPKNLQNLGVKVGALTRPETFVRKALRRLFRKKKQYINGLLNRFAIFTISLLPTRVRLILKHKMLDNKHENIN